ncbi:TPA: MobA/MobL family protein [Escherichia coli]|nr:MobA/MobL family protein [Escherichia coli]
MAIFHLSVKTISRSAGRSATAAIAYRTGSRIVDERTGIIHDYTRKSGVEHSEIFLPQNSPDWASNRETLWNAVEQKENRRNSTVAREFELAFPAELDGKQRLDLLRDFCSSLVERHGMAVDAAIHAPGKEGDQRNYHAHVLCSTRRLSEEGFKDKTRELDDFKSGEVNYWRSAWSEMTNRHLEKAGRSERIDHRSLEAQRESAISQGDSAKAAELDRVPTIHIGYAAAQMEKRGIETERGNEHRQIILRNAEIQPLSRAIQLIENWRATHDNNSRAGHGSIAPVPERDTGRDRRGFRTAQSNTGRAGAVPPPSARGRLRNLSELDMVRFGERSEMLLPGNVSRDVEHQRTDRNQPLRRENTVTSKPKRPEVIRLEWQRLRRDKLTYVHDKAGRIAARGAAQVERQRQKISSHERQRPEQPSGLIGMFKRSAYEQAASTWQTIKNGLDRRLVQLKNRLGFVRGYMRKSGAYEMSTPGERLADQLAAKENPILAGQIKSLNAQKNAEDMAAYRTRVQSRKQEKADMKLETIEELKQRGDARRDKADKAERAELEKASHQASLQNETIGEETKELESGEKEKLSKRDQVLEKFKAKFERDKQNERGGRGR